MLLTFRAFVFGARNAVRRTNRFWCNQCGRIYFEGEIQSNRGPIMSLRCVVRCACLGWVLISAATLLGQTAGLGSAGRTTLQEQFDRAQEFQRDGKLSEAAGQYRGFLAEALGKLAVGYAMVPDYTRAAPLFDEALSLQPNSPTLLLDYARTALTMGDFAHAKTLATEFIRKYPENRQRLAEAHQVLGRALLKLNQDREARKQLETALALDPTFANGYDLAVACLDLDDEQCAVQIFSEMERSFGDTAEIHPALRPKRMAIRTFSP